MQLILLQSRFLVGPLKMTQAPKLSLMCAVLPTQVWNLGELLKLLPAVLAHHLCNSRIICSLKKVLFVLFTSVFQILAGKAMNVKFNLGKLVILKGQQKKHWLYNTLDSGINIGLCLIIFGLFSRGCYVLIREANAYFFSKYPLFDGMGDAYFKGYT